MVQRDFVQRSLMNFHHARLEEDLLQASAFVVQSVTSPGQRVEWMAKMGGLTIVSSDFAMGSHQVGTWLKYQGISHLSPVRHLLLDQHFRQRHPSITAVLQKIFGRPGSTWKICVTLSDSIHCCCFFEKNIHISICQKSGSGNFDSVVGNFQGSATSWANLVKSRKSSSGICWALVPDGPGQKEKFAQKLGISPTAVRMLTCREFLNWGPACKIEAAQYGVSQS